MGIAKRWQVAVAAGIAALGIGALLAACTQPEPQPQASCTLTKDDPIRIVTYNIRIARGLEDPGRRPPVLALQPEEIAPVVAAIASLDPDVVALQEVLGARQADRIAEQLGMRAVTALHPSYVPWWGVSVLSKCPITLLDTPVVSPGPTDGKRAAVARIDLVNGPIAVASIHKDTDLRDGTSLDRISLAAEAIDMPLVLAGDFNLRPDDDRFKRLGRKWRDSALEAKGQGAARAQTEGTFVSGKPRRIDYIFVDETVMQVEDVKLADPVHDTASDHRAYLAVVRLNDG